MKQIFYFTAEWCGPCRSLGPVMEKVAEKILVEKINIDYETDRTKAAKVMSIPTVVLVEKGEEIRRFTGPKSYQEVMNFING
jgi:thioredoxin-like negative regulator of GroEL